ncbi:fructosamine kinase family protein [Mucilaginibacter ginsenosidivorax]|uniref:Fructosamine kinase family protein n=1 Tax=Mucilaginibacter ginsenosidivorax TaxID=862126 RepID=A0A5B8WDP5_9SPHI|nr:fructosamine kinase family protein [Mucilaginibacter ginsenosidivorax]QEC80028.1 fructosamine kinase family protein [Mucilaginibacter ginsenosidivorax]
MHNVNDVILVIEKQIGTKISNILPLSGGSINHVYHLQATRDNFVLKINDRFNFPGMFNLEVQGLETIRNTQTIAVPKVLLQSETNTESYLLIEWISPGHSTQKASDTLGEQLAQMHRHTSHSFGFDTDNYMGSLRQSNKPHKYWNDFFIEERLKPMIRIAQTKQLLTNNDLRLFDLLYQKLPGLFTEEPPALVHGDLWSGNYLIDVHEKPYLIDPAVSFSNREFDIAMTTLFGGFDRQFYEAYNHNFPLQEGWQQRIKLWNLYPLLLHVNLFGGGYIKLVRDNLTALL